jgi:hypothetical protein
MASRQYRTGLRRQAHRLQFTSAADDLPKRFNKNQLAAIENDHVKPYGLPVTAGAVSFW